MSFWNHWRFGYHAMLIAGLSTLSFMTWPGYWDCPRHVVALSQPRPRPASSSHHFGDLNKSRTKRGPLLRRAHRALKELPWDGHWLRNTTKDEIQDLDGLALDITQCLFACLESSNGGTWPLFFDVRTQGSPVCHVSNLIVCCAQGPVSHV